MMTRHSQAVAAETLSRASVGKKPWKEKNMRATNANGKPKVPPILYRP